jgi:hypothetical protein
MRTSALNPSHKHSINTLLQHYRWYKLQFIDVLNCVFSIIFMNVPSSDVEFLLITRSCTANDIYKQTSLNDYNKQRPRPTCV